jgi:hypothetical protein
MSRSFGPISGAFALRNHAFALKNWVAAAENGLKMRIWLSLSQRILESRD